MVYQCFFGQMFGFGGFGFVQVGIMDGGVGQYGYGVGLYFQQIVGYEYEFFVCLVCDFDMDSIWFDVCDQWGVMGIDIQFICFVW